MKARHVRAVALTLMLLLVVVVPASAAGAEPVVTREQSDFSARVNNPCSGEEVLITGQTNIVSIVVLNPAGRSLLRSHQNEIGSGVGVVSGMQYQYVNNANSVDSFAADDLPFITTFQSEWHVIGDGPDNNFFITGIFHRTVNPDGTVTSEVGNFTVECR